MSGNRRGERENLPLALSPPNTSLAQRMMGQTMVFRALRWNVCWCPLASWCGATLDSRSGYQSPAGHVRAHACVGSAIVLQKPTVREEDLPKPAIRPYPSQYVWPWKLRNGSEVTIRPIRPEDEPLMVEFHKTLSERTVYMRYFSSLSLRRRVDHERLLRICFGGYDREIVLVAEGKTSAGERKILGVGRLNKLGTDNNQAEVAVLVSDAMATLCPVPDELTDEQVLMCPDIMSTGFQALNAAVSISEISSRSSLRVQ